ncbi:MAG: hypothetical protein NVS3B29_08160 [Candidatus Saccharimonadales bacterium]
MLKRILFILGYISFTLAIMAITVALVAYGNDYIYDFSAGKVIQKGHVIINSLPSGVRVIEDGKQLKKNTPYQAAVKVGDHTYQLIKDGFEPWQKVLHVVAGRVALASYVIFVPKNPVKTTLDSHPQIVAQTISKDHQHLAYITAGPDAAVYTLDLSTKKVVKQYTPKAAVAATPTAPAAAAEVLKDVSWSDDASHLLIVSDMGTPVPEYRLATAGSTDTPLDLTQTFGFNLSGLTFSGSNWRQLYWLSPDGLRRLDVDSSSVSSVLADKVTQFWVQPDRILYVQRTDLGRTLWSIDHSNKRQDLVQALPESDSYVVAQAKYNGDDELVVVPSKTGIATLYSGIYGDTPVAKVIAKDITAASFAPDSHKLALSSAKAVFVYDLERTVVEQNFTLYTIDVPAGLASLSWFDNDHVLTGRGGDLYWSEYDGANALVLSNTAGFPGYPDANNRAILVYKPADAAGTQITQIQIR